MILRNPKEPLFDEPVENGFEAIDERTGERLGCCVVHAEPNPALFPARPNNFRLEFAGEFSAFGKTLGAAMALARALAAREKEPARIYAACPPEDNLLLAALEQYGFQDNDGLVRMELDFERLCETRMPAGCVLVEDELTDAEERGFFLERYNQLFQTARDFSWLDEYTAADGFRRILCVSPTGLAGELICWREDGGIGRIGYLHTARRWRNMGVARHLLRLAGEYFEDSGVSVVVADVRARIPLLLHTLESAGFCQTSLIMRYPGVDVG